MIADFTLKKDPRKKDCAPTNFLKFVDCGTLRHGTNGRTDCCFFFVYGVKYFT